MSVLQKSRFALSPVRAIVERQLVWGIAGYWLTCESRPVVDDRIGSHAFIEATECPNLRIADDVDITKVKLDSLRTSPPKAVGHRQEWPYSHGWMASLRNPDAG
jgi:hypothetical protein